MSQRYTYHYYAITQTTPGEIIHLDGMVTRDSPILTMEHYAGVKQRIAELGEDKFDPAKLTICSLSLIHTGPLTFQQGVSQ